jgi:hypothetical protein
MALTAEEKLQVAEAVGVGLIAREVADRLLSGRVTKAEMSLFRSVMRVGGGMVARGLARAPGTALGVAARGAGFARFVAMRHPLIAAGAVIAVGYHEREKIADLLAQGYDIIPEGVAVGDPGAFPTVRPGPLAVYTTPAKVKRAVSKANRAVKEGMKMLKQGGKAATGASKGRLPAKAFLVATKAAGLANPKTKSKIGKAATKINKLARRLKKWW